MRGKRSAGGRGVSVHRLQSDRHVVGPRSTGAAATSAPVVGGIGVGAGSDGGRHVVADEATIATTMTTKTTKTTKTADGGAIGDGKAKNAISEKL